MKTCPGQFKCNNSVTCLAITNICDKYIDCPGGDDEHWCDHGIPVCPSKCSCLFFSIVCNTTELLIESTRRNLDMTGGHTRAHPLHKYSQSYYCTGHSDGHMLRSVYNETYVNSPVYYKLFHHLIKDNPVCHHMNMPKLYNNMNGI